MITFLRKSRGVPYPDNGCSGSSWLVHFFSLIAVLLWLVPNTAGATDFYFKGSFNGWSHAETTYKLDASKTEQSFAFTGSDLYSKNSNSSTVNFNVYGVDGSNTWDIRPNTTDYNVTVNGGAVAMSSVNNGNNDNGTSRGHSAVVNIENNANITYTFTFNRTGSDWNDCTVKVTSSSVSSSTTYSVVGADLTETNTNGSATFSGYTPTTSTDVSFTIGSTTYGVSGTTSIDKAGTTTFSTSDNTLVSGGSQKLTLSSDFTYTFTLTDGKVTVVASSKSTPVTPTGTDAGLYLVGNFFNTDDNTNINYDRRIFKFTQQKDGTYSVEIPATLYANAQILSVGDNGETVYGPTDGGTSGYGLHAGTSSSDAGWPATDGYVFSGTTTWGALSSVSSKSLDSHYWHLLTRNNNVANYGDDDGTYTFYITLNNGVPSTWNVKHNVTRRVTYFLSDDADATAQPLENRRDGVSSSFNNEVKALVHFKDGRHLYYFVSNQLRDRDDVTNGETSGGYAEYNNTAKYGDVKPHQNQRNQDVMPTSSKLFLCGNNNEDWATSNHDNIANPNEGGIYFDKPEGIYNLIFNPTQGTRDLLVGNGNADHYGLSAEIKFNEQTPVFTSVAILGSAIPGTFDGTSTEADGDLTKWHWASPLAMTYNESTRAYEVTIETTRNQGSTADSPAGWFRFEADPTTTSTRDNVKTWCDDATLANVPYPTATGGSNATEADPNQVTLSTKYADTENNIKFNREPGKYTIRFYAEKRLNGASYDDYYAYTITADPNSIKIAPRDEIVEFGSQVSPTVTVTTGDAETSTRYFVFTYDGTDPKDVPLNDNTVKSYTPSTTTPSASIGTFGIDVNNIFGYTFGRFKADLSSAKDEEGYYTVTIRAMAVKKNGDTYVQLPNVTDKVTYKFAPEIYSLNINAGGYTKDLNDVPENYDNSFLGINTVDLLVTVGKGTEVKEPTPEPEPNTAKKKVNRQIRRIASLDRGETNSSDPLNGQNVYYHVWDGKQWGPTMNVVANVDRTAHIYLHTLSSDLESADNKVEVWIDGQVKSNTYAKKLLKYDITYSTSDGSYKDAIIQSLGSSSDEFNIYVLDADPSNKEIYARVVSNTQDASSESPKTKTIFLSPDNGTLLTSKKTIGVKEWYVFTITDLWYYFGEQNGSFSVQFADAANRDKIASATTFDNLTGDVFFEYKGGTFTQDDSAPEGFISSGNLNLFPESLGDESWKIPVTGVQDAGLRWSKTSQNPYLSYMNATSGSPVSFTVPAASLVGGSKYTVQAIVRAADSESDTESSSTATLDLKAGDATATSGTISVSSTSGGNVSKDGRVDVFATSSDTGYGWKKLEATVTEPATAQDLTMTFTAGSGADIYITNLILLKDANTPGHFWTKAPTSEGTTSYDLSSRTTANAFSYFDRGDNKNAIVFANDKTVIGGCKEGMKIPDVDLQYIKQGDVFSSTKSPYNVAVKGTDGYTIETLKLTDNGSEVTNPHAFGYNVSSTVKANKVEYDRDFVEGYQTVCLPFALSSSQLSDLGAIAYSLTGFTLDKANKKAYMNFEAVSETTAGKPYILKCDAAKSGLTGSNLDLKGAATNQPATNGDDFKGFFNQQVVPLNPNDKGAVPEYWGFSRSGAFMPSRFAWENKGQTRMKPFRGYFTLGNATKTALAKIAPSSTKNLRMYFAIDGTATGISDLSVEAETINNAPIFNLSGQMVSKDGNRNNLKRGVYIQNNKKFVVK